jgi:hypothetical protein
MEQLTCNDNSPSDSLHGIIYDSRSVGFPVTLYLADIDFAFADQAVDDRRIADSTGDYSTAFAAIFFRSDVSKASPSGHIEGRACVEDW